MNNNEWRHWNGCVTCICVELHRYWFFIVNNNHAWVIEIENISRTGYWYRWINIYLVIFLVRTSLIEFSLWAGLSICIPITFQAIRRIVNLPPKFQPNIKSMSLVFRFRAHCVTLIRWCSILDLGHCRTRTIPVARTSILSRSRLLRISFRRYFTEYVQIVG